MIEMFFIGLGLFLIVLGIIIQLPVLGLGMIIPILGDILDIPLGGALLLIGVICLLFGGLSWFIKANIWWILGGVVIVLIFSIIKNMSLLNGRKKKRR